MSAVAGIFCFNSNFVVNNEPINQMLNSVKHRGPDGLDFYFSEKCHLGIALSNLIGDSSSNFLNLSNSRFKISFDGAIYNFKEIRSELKKIGVVFSSDSDAEVILKGYELWGVEIVERLKAILD